MKITLSKGQWELIGKKTGWMKIAQGYQNDTKEILENLRYEKTHGPVAEGVRQHMKNPIDKGTFGPAFPAVESITGDNFEKFTNEIYHWRARFQNAANELKTIKPPAGSMDELRMRWAQQIAGSLNQAMNPKLIP